MSGSNVSTFIYGLGLCTLLLAGVAFAEVPTSSPAHSPFLLQQPTDTPTARPIPPTVTPTDVAPPNLTATLYFTQTQTAVARTATAAAMQTAVAAATQTAARATAIVQTATAAAMQTAVAQTATAVARTPRPTVTASPTVPAATATPLYTITPLLGGGGVVPTVTPIPSPTLPSTGLPLAWIIVGGVLILIVVGARYLRASAGR